MALPDTLKLPQLFIRAAIEWLVSAVRQSDLSRPITGWPMMVGIHEPSSVELRFGPPTRRRR
jgi:hypothetical protein